MSTAKSTEQPITIGTIVRWTGQLAEVVATPSAHQTVIVVGDKQRKVGTHLLEFVAAPQPPTHEGGDDDDEHKVYSQQEAADYLGIHIQTLKWWTLNQKALVHDGDLGNSKFFYKSTLDEFTHKYLNREEDYLTMQEAAEKYAAHGLTYAKFRHAYYTQGIIASAAKRGREHVFREVDILRAFDIPAQEDANKTIE